MNRVSSYLQERGYPPHVVEFGAAGLLRAWARAAAQPADDLDDFLNDLDGRRVLYEIRRDLPGALSAGELVELARADEAFRAHTVESRVCAWGEDVAAENGWDSETHWWYFRQPNAV